MIMKIPAPKQTANIAVIGAGWWSQGWHLPHLHRNDRVKLAAIVDSSSHPKSNLNQCLEPLAKLAEAYKVQNTFSSVADLLNDPNVGPTLDGALVATPHATHYEVGELLLGEGMRRKRDNKDYRPMNILMEKPMTTNVHEAKKMHDHVQTYREDGGKGCFLINHSANYRAETKMARQLVESGEIGAIRHVTSFMASPLSFIFDDPSNTGWNEPTAGMLGNGFSWGQCSHLLAWIFHVCPNLLPHNVFCIMNQSPATGADVSHSASIVCSDTCGTNDVVLSMSGTSMLPGNAHSEPAIGKILRIKIFGTKGTIMYSGNDQDPSSGQLELRRVANNGNVELPCGPGFHFEALEQDGTGPESLQSFIDACHGNKDYYVGADSTVGLRTVQILEAMYRSNSTRKLEDILYA